MKKYRVTLAKNKTVIAYLDLDVVPDDFERYSDGVTAFYALWDSIRMVMADIDKLEKDIRIIDVVEAINRKK